MNKKMMIPIISLMIVAVIGAGFAFMFLNKRQTTVTIEEYHSSLDSMVKNTRSGQEKWEHLLGGGIDFQDLCTGYYSEKFRELGQNFVDIAQHFETLHIKDGKPETVIPDHPSYQTYFGTYRVIGEKLILFSDYVDAGKYNQAVIIIDELIRLYDTLPNLY